MSSTCALASSASVSARVAVGCRGGQPCITSGGGAVREKRHRRLAAVVVNGYGGGGPGAGIDKVRQIIANETGKEGSRGFGPPPPEGKSRGQGFVNLSFRDTEVSDGYSEASASQDEGEQEAGLADARLITQTDVFDRAQTGAQGPEEGGPRPSVWDKGSADATEDAEDNKRYIFAVSLLLLTGLARRLYAKVQHTHRDDGR